MRYLLDTNALSETARPQPSPHLMARLERHRAVVCTAAVVWHELVGSARRAWTVLGIGAAVAVALQAGVPYPPSPPPRSPALPRSAR